MRRPKHYLNPNYLHKKGARSTSLLVFSVLCSIVIIFSTQSPSSSSTVEIGTNVLEKRVEIGSSVSFTIDLYNSDEINSHIINMSLTFIDNPTSRAHTPDYNESHPSYSFSKRSLVVPAESSAETILTFDCTSNCTSGEKIYASVIGYHTNPFIKSNSNNMTNTFDIVIDPFDSS